MIKKIWLSFKNKLLPYCIAYTAKISLRILLRTCRIEIQGLEDFIAAASRSPCILMLWHNRLIILAEILNSAAPQFNYTAFISKSRDGDPLALLAKSYKKGKVLRVPHNARHRALSKMIDHLKEKQEVILITPDGPRGPRYIVKPGIVLAARESSAKIIPFSWSANRTWKLPTWDIMQIPKPFSKIKVIFGSALTLPQEQKQSLENEAIFLQDSLLSISKD